MCENAPRSLFEFDHLGVWSGHLLLGKCQRRGECSQYLLGQKPSLLRCLSEPRARIENNLVEQAIRPLKLGAKNWLQIGHPKAGPRLANLFTVVENCRLAGVDV